MQKKSFFLTTILVASVAGLFVTTVGQEEKKYNSSIIKVGDKVLHVYVNGEDVTDEYINVEQRTKEYIARFLNRECSEIQFKDYCMLEMDGMTVEAEVEGIDYTFLLNIDGELLSVARSDGKKLRE